MTAREELIDIQKRIVARLEEEIRESVVDDSPMMRQYRQEYEQEVQKYARTATQRELVQKVMEADIILMAGEAGSHCLANTVRDADSHFADSSFIKKLVLLTDATSPVPSCEALQEQFIKDMTAKGMQTDTTTNFLAQ